jgi:hypothetical protein
VLALALIGAGNLLRLLSWPWPSRRSAPAPAENPRGGKVSGAANPALDSLVDVVETLIADSGIRPIAAFGRGKLVSKIAGEAPKGEK